MLPPVSLAMAKADAAGAAARAALLGQPGVVGLAAEPDVVEGQGAEAQLGYEDGGVPSRGRRGGGVDRFSLGATASRRSQPG
jgi:hypothetical protein